MANGRKGAVKGLIVFLMIMAALTFFSRTIYYGTLTKVEAQRVGSGVLQSVVSGSTFIVDSEETKRVELPTDLSEYKLRVEQVWAQKHAPINRGEALLRFNPAQGANALGKAEQARQRAEEALQAWDLKYQAAWKKLGTDIAALQKKMTEADADLDALGIQIQSLRDEQATLERTRMLEGVSRASLEQALSFANAALDALTALNEQDWTVYAGEDGVIGEVSVKAGDEYAGLLPLVRLITSSAKLRVGIECDSKAEILSPDQVTVYGSDSAPRTGETGWAFAGESAQGGKRVLWAEPTKALPDLTKMTQLNFRIDSDYCQRMVPNSAVVGGAVFVLDSRIGSFGAEELYARRVEVKGTQSDAKNTNVAVGLTGMDNVIVKWDRPFADGDTVILPLS